MRLFHIICMLVLFQFCSHSDTTTEHYVDKNAKGHNNGTSWRNAWKSFSDIDWSQLQPGDVLYISGGTDSTVYYERLNIGNVQGTADNPVTIKNSYDAGHNGRVIIDASTLPSGLNDCILIGGSYGWSTDYVTVSGLELRECRYGILLSHYTKSIIIDSMDVYDWDENGLHTAGVTHVPESIDGLTIQNSSWIGRPLGGSDCIQFNSSSNHIIRNNFIHMRNSQYENNHVDCILGIWCEGFRIYNNIMIVDSNAQGQACIVRAWADAANEDSVIIYNNFMYMGGLFNSNEFNWGAVLNLRFEPSEIATYGVVRPPTYVAHNTIIVNGPYFATLMIESFPTFVNNICVQFGDGLDPAQWLYNLGTRIGSSYVDSLRQNLIWREWASNNPHTMFAANPAYWVGNGTRAHDIGWTEWVNTLGGTGVNANPLFVIDYNHTGGITDQSALNGELRSNSPAINQGEDIQAIIEKMGLPWTDINGNPRPNSPTLPDIGAYQYVP
jgi:hypothetical protein